MSALPISGRRNNSRSMEFVRESLAILFVLGLLWTALWFVRNRGWAVRRRVKVENCILESRGKLALTARHSIHVVRIGDRDLILALHPEGVTFLGRAQQEAAGVQRR